MKIINCEYCGTEYNEELGQCPLCGRTAHGAVSGKGKRSSRGGSRVAPKKGRRSSGRSQQDRIPQWMWAVFCVLLGLAILIGLIYFLVSMEYIGGRDPEPEQEVVAPAVVPEPEYEAEDPEPAVEQPQDLSCTSLDLSQTGIVLDVKGGTVFLTAIPTPSNTSDLVVFSSADEDVATVDQTGMITAVGRGQTEILVTCGKASNSCIVICDIKEEEEAPEVEPEEEEQTEQKAEPEEDKPEEETEEKPKMRLNTVDFTFFRPGEETTVKVLDAPEGASITYASSDPDVVTISDTGKVKAVGNGTATLTMTVNGEKLTCIARCKLGETTENNEEPPAEQTTETVGADLSISHTDVTLIPDETFVLSLFDEAGNKADGLSWTTSDPAVCTVSGSGKVTAVGSGTATVSTTYGGRTYSCIVRCRLG